MTASNLTNLKAAAQAVTGDMVRHARPLTPEKALRFMRLVTPAVVLELVERLERAEARLAPNPSERQGELTIVMYMRQGDTLFSAGRHVHAVQLRSFATGAIDHVRMESSRVFQDLQAHITGAMPNDQLDDVLPLAQRGDYPPPLPLPSHVLLPLNLTAPPDLPDSEGGHHD